MPMTVAELKEVVEITISGIEIKDLDQFTILFVDSLGEETNIDDSGILEVIKSTICGDTLETYFVFIASGSREEEFSYATLKKVLDEADDTELVYFYKQLISIPANDGWVIAIESAVLDIKRLDSVADNGTQTSSGILTLSDVPPPPCSSSSSSSS